MGSLCASTLIPLSLQNQQDCDLRHKCCPRTSEPD
jgi:hypothetical protein